MWKTILSLTPIIKIGTSEKKIKLMHKKTGTKSRNIKKELQFWS